MTLLETVELEGLISLESAFADPSAITFTTDDDISEFHFTAIPSFEHSAWKKIYSRLCRS